MPQKPYRKVVEQHGCIVCGRVYNVFVLYNPAGRLVDFTVTDPGGKKIPNPDRPLVACYLHTEEQVKEALVKHYPGKAQEEEDE